MKILKTIWAALPIILAFIVYFGYLRILPTFVKVVLFALFVIIWLSRKPISETIISKLKHISALDHFMWDDAGQKKDENGKLTQERKPIESNIKLVKILINVAILLVLLGVPMLICGLFVWLGGLFEGIANAFETVFQDLGFSNGVGFFIFAIFEILVTLASIAAIVLAVIKYRKFEWNARKSAIIAGTAFLVQRIFSWCYFGSSASSIFGEIFTLAFIVAIIWAVVRFDLINKFRAWRHSKPIVVDPDEGDDDFYDDDDDDIDPIG